jgi:hypothetical protein
MSRARNGLTVLQSHECQNIFSSHLGRRVNGELQFAFFPVVRGQPFHEQRSETGTGAATERVEYQKSLEPGALVRELSDPVQHQVDDLFADGVVTTRVIVSCVLFARDQLFWVKQLSVRAGPHFVCNKFNNNVLSSFCCSFSLLHPQTISK